jgi:hypothetical protein
LDGTVDRRVPLERAMRPGTIVVARVDEAFEFGLREMGYIVGQNIAIEYRWTEGKSALLGQLLAS